MTRTREDRIADQLARRSSYRSPKEHELAEGILDALADASEIEDDLASTRQRILTGWLFGQDHDTVVHVLEMTNCVGYWSVL